MRCTDFLIEKQVTNNDEIGDNSDMHYGAVNADGSDQNQFDEDEVWNDYDA
jgi:hypothetical protein